MSNPFDYVNQILYGKKNLIVDAQTEKEYNPFIVNRSLSYHFDCVLFANEMNQRHFVDKKLQNSFLINTIRSRKRPFTKWIKPEQNELVEVIKKYFGYSDDKALESLKILSKEQIDFITSKMNPGGLKNTK